jgi:beta-lactam-binding protein with PASTA domain
MKLDFKKFNKNTLGGVLLHFFIAVGLVFLLGILYFYAYLPSSTNHGETITVPNIEGKNVKEVEEFLAKHDLRFEVNDSSYSDKYPPLTVLKQYPHAGAKVKEDRKIYISLNRVNPPTVSMPNLVDVSIIGAEAILKANELKRGKIELVSWPFPTVKEMKYQGRTIAPGFRIAKGSAVDLVIGDGGSKDVTTPNVIGYILEDAKIPIFGSNLSIGTVTLVGDTLDAKPVILKQKPMAGENIKVGDIVDLWIGKPGSTVPDDEEEIDR